MRKIVFIICFSILTFLSHAQLQISGKIRSIKPVTLVLEDLNGKVILNQQIEKGGVFKTDKVKAETDLYKLKIGANEIYVILENKPATLNGFCNDISPEASELAFSGVDYTSHYKQFTVNRTTAQKMADDFIASSPSEIEQLIMLSNVVLRKDYLTKEYELFVSVREKCKALKNSIVYSKLEEIIASNSTFALNAPAYNFTAVDEAGKSHSLSDYKGKIVLLDFWASWCGPCRAEMKSLHKIYDELKGDDLQFISLSLDDTKEKWCEALKDDNIPWLALWEGITVKKSAKSPGFFDSVIRPEYGFDQIPFIVLIDKSGNTVKRFLRGEDVKKEIEILRKKSK